MAKPPTMVIQEDYIDMDLTPSSPCCTLLEFEFQNAVTAAAAAGCGASKHREAPADELFYRGKLLPLHLPPRLQLVQKLLHEQQLHVEGMETEAVAPGASASAAAACATDAEVEDDAKACAKKFFWSKRLKLMKRWTSREYIRSLFLPKASDIGNGGGGGGRGRGSVLDQDELCGHRRSFSGIIRRVRLIVATKAAATAPGTSPQCSSSSSSSLSTPSYGNADGFFLRARATTTPALKRSSSAGSEEGAIQGAIAHCKRSHQQQQGRRSVSGVVFYSVSNTPRISSSVAAAAANEAAAQERQEMCRG